MVRADPDPAVRQHRREPVSTPWVTDGSAALELLVVISAPIGLDLRSKKAAHACVKTLLRPAAKHQPALLLACLNHEPLKACSRHRPTGASRPGLPPAGRARRGGNRAR